MKGSACACALSVTDRMAQEGGGHFCRKGKNVHSTPSCCCSAHARAHALPLKPPGTMRLQLSNKGSNAETYSNFGNVVVAFAFLLIPVIGWLLDKKVCVMGAWLSGP